MAQEILEWLGTVLLAVLIALPLRTFVYAPVFVRGRSMMDTLRDRDLLFVSRLRYTSVWLCLPWQKGAAKEASRHLTLGGEPGRNDVVICRYPGRGGTRFVKRVVGLPGDTVELSEGYVLINGEQQPEPFINPAYRRGPGGRFGPYTVPKGHYFVLGDHRNQSLDSRRLGAIPRDYIIGRARAVLFPPKRIRKIR